MKILPSLKEVRMGDLVGFRFKNAERSTQKEISTWVGIAKALRRFEEEDNQSFRKYKTGEIYRVYKKLQFQIQLLNKTSRIGTYLGVRNERSKKFECCLDYNKKSWELYLIEGEKDVLEVEKEIMADVLELKDGTDYLEYIPYFLSSPWLDYAD